MNVIDNVSSKHSLCEIGHGQREVSFAFLDYEKSETITPYCKCKDFFGDMFWSNDRKEKVAIYGFIWTPNQDGGVLDKDMLVVSLRLKDKSTHEDHKIKKKEVDSLRSLLDRFNTPLGYTECIAELSDDEKNIIVQFDKRWCQNPYAISCLFFILRLGLTYKVGEDPIEFFSKGNNFISPNDAIYFNKSKQRIIDLLDGKMDTSQKFSDYTIHQIHHNTGLVNHSKYKVV